MLAEIDTLASTPYACGGEVLRREVDRRACPPAGGGSPAGEPGDRFARSRALFDAEVAWLSERVSGGLSHEALEERLAVSARELHRQLLQDHLDLRAVREERQEEVVGVDGVLRGQLERGHTRPLRTVFGPVTVTRLGYRARRAGCERLFPADAVLNLPVDLHSHGLRRLAAIESARGSFQDAQHALVRATGQQIGKRQIEQLAGQAAVDFHEFYAQRQIPNGEDEGSPRVQVLSCDGKGIVMRPGALRAQTARQAERSAHKLTGRLSKGEKRGRKRMAEVAAVYQVTPAARTIQDILPESENPGDHLPLPGPSAEQKWLTASVTDDAAVVIGQAFDEAERRDPEHQRTWIALVDGNSHQIDRINHEAKARGVSITILIDFVHVIEYLWKAAWCFYIEGDPAAQDWVHGHMRKILDGQATHVAGLLRRTATNGQLAPADRAGVDTCADYLTSKAPYLDYPTALSSGWPIATGVIEGACRHLIKDRMDITGARWGLQGAEAILKLRAIHTNGDIPEYWAYHLTQEHQRVHQSRYAATPSPS